MKEVTEADFEAAVLGAALPVVLDFYSTESKPCEALAPRFAAVAQKFARKVAFFRILRQGGGGASAKLGVTGSPTVVFFKGGKEAGERLSGGRDPAHRHEITRRGAARVANRLAEAGGDRPRLGSRIFHTKTDVADEEVLPYCRFGKNEKASILYWMAYRHGHRGGYAGTSLVDARLAVFTAATEERLKVMAAELGFDLRRDDANT